MTSSSKFVGYLSAWLLGREKKHFIESCDEKVKGSTKIYWKYFEKNFHVCDQHNGITWIIYFQGKLAFFPFISKSETGCFW